MEGPKEPRASVLSGAAFLMAVSAIGPGFLTQTTQFTVRLGAGLAFAILLSTVIDCGAQLTTWRIIGITRRRGHELAGAVVPGLGVVVTSVIVLGALAFNIGNLGGCALALEALFGLPLILGASLSALLAVALFLVPQALRVMDGFAKVLGVGMIGMTCYVLLRTTPPLAEAARQAVWPDEVDPAAVVTLVGGTVGGYIMFSGAHRLLDGGVHGIAQVAQITWAAVQGILITAIMRTLVFLAVLGVLNGGAEVGGSVPVFDAFRAGAGPVGFVLSVLIFWSAAITSVVGCAYTSASFLRSAESGRGQQRLMVGFTLASLALLLGLREAGWQATPLLVLAGTVNGVLLPVVFGAILLAAYRKDLVGTYRHPAWAGLLGMLAWATTAYLAYQVARQAWP